MDSFFYVGRFNFPMYISTYCFIEDIYILQCTKLKIGCLICKYRIFL